jgi:hypothetical protein
VTRDTDWGQAGHIGRGTLVASRTPLLNHWCSATLIFAQATFVKPGEACSVLNYEARQRCQVSRSD